MTRENHLYARFIGVHVEKLSEALTEINAAELPSGFRVIRDIFHASVANWRASGARDDSNLAAVERAVDRVHAECKSLVESGFLLADPVASLTLGAAERVHHRRIASSICLMGCPPNST